MSRRSANGPPLTLVAADRRPGDGSPAPSGGRAEGPNAARTNRIAFCPNFPDCGCTASCMEEDETRVPEGALVFLVVLAAIVSAGAVVAWLLLRGA